MRLTLKQHHIFPPLPIDDGSLSDILDMWEIVYRFHSTIKAQEGRIVHGLVKGELQFLKDQRKIIHRDGEFRYYITQHSSPFMYSLLCGDSVGETNRMLFSIDEGLKLDLVVYHYMDYYMTTGKPGSRELVRVGLHQVRHRMEGWSDESIRDSYWVAAYLTPEEYPLKIRAGLFCETGVSRRVQELVAMENL